MPAAESAPSFSPWRDVDAPGALPAGPAVVQVKLAAGLVDYPGGRSAMVLYLWTHDLEALPASVLPAIRARVAEGGLAAPLRFRFRPDAESRPGDGRAPRPLPRPLRCHPAPQRPAGPVSRGYWVRPQ